MSLREGARVIEADGFGDKVLRLSGRFIPEAVPAQAVAVISTALAPFSTICPLMPDCLPKGGFPSVTVIRDVSHPCHQADGGCTTSRWPGKTLRQVLRDATGDSSGLIRLLGQFMARLHEKGICFRSLHLGNVVLTPDHELGLIDIADMRCGRFCRCGRSGYYATSANLTRSGADMELLDLALKKQLIEAYCEASSRPEAFSGGTGESTADLIGEQANLTDQISQGTSGRVWHGPLMVRNRPVQGVNRTRGPATRRQWGQDGNRNRQQGCWPDIQRGYRCFHVRGC